MNKVIMDALLVAGGFLMGILIGWAAGTAKKRNVKDAPVPMGYDVNNPINGKGREKVNVCGRDWYIMR